MKYLVIFLFCLPMSLFGQHFEAGLLVGGTNYLGELASNSSQIYLKETNIAAGAFAKYNVNHLVAFRLGFNYTTISGEDRNSGNTAIIDRNLNFQSDIYEVGLIGEFNLLGYQPYNYTATFSPYLFGGIAFFQFNPQGELNGQLYDLQPLGTEGQHLTAIPERTPYKLSQFAIPFGVGFKYTLTETLNLGVEVGARKLFTDYLDDVSLTYPGNDAFAAESASLETIQLSHQGTGSLGNNVAGVARGDNNVNDWYFILGVTLSFNFLDNGLIGGRKRSRGGKTGCPTF
ncbi:MAG: DUF6089 family protein [Saprospiraceae bacterium]